MINDIQLITKSAKTAEESTVVVKVGAGKAGQATIIKAQAGVSYELRDIIKNRAPDQLLFKRKGKDLLILLNTEGNDTDKDQPADIVIENYYGEGKVKLIGIAEDGQYYTYLPQEGTTDLLSWEMTDGTSTYQSLGELHEQVAWLPFALAGLAAAAIGAASGGGDPDPVNNPPAAKNDTVVVDEDGSVTFNPTSNDTDADGDKLTVTQINGIAVTPGKAQDIAVPNGVVHVATDGTMTFTPDPNYNGSVEFPYTISDGKGGTSSATVHITVNPVDDPSVLKADVGTSPEDIPATGNVLSNDSDIDSALSVATFTVNGTTVKAGETATIPNVGTITIAANGDYTFTPAPNWNGTVPTITYTTNTGSSSTLDITVTPVDDTPVASDDTAITPEDTPIIINVLANDTDADGDKLTVLQIDGQDVTVGVPVPVEHGTATLNADGTITFTPEANYNGPATFTYTTSDGRTPVTSDVNVTVTPVNDPPVAADDSGSTKENTPVTLNVLGNDKDADGDPLTITEIDGTPVQPGDVVTLKDGTGTATLNPDGTITFTPNPAYNGPATFTYTVTDGKGGVDSGTVNIAVSNEVHAPVANPDTNSTTEDATLTVDASNGVIHNAAGQDTDLDKDTLSVSQVGFGGTAGTVGQALSGAWGTLVLNADGSYTYTPNAEAQKMDDGESQTDVFTYTVTDPGGLTASTTLTIKVTGLNDAPVAVDDVANIPKDKPVTLDILDNDTDIDGEKLSITEINGSPVTIGTPVVIKDLNGNEIGTVTLNPDGTVTVDPTDGYLGAIDFDYTVSDGTATDEGHVKVKTDNNPPNAEDNLVVGTEDTKMTFDPRSNDTDPESDPLTITAINGTPITVGTPVTIAEGVITLNPDGTLSFQPNPDYNGEFTFNYTIADTSGATDVAAVKVIINPVDDPSVLNADVGTTPEDITLAGNVLSNDKDIDSTLSVATFTVNGTTVKAGETLTVVVKDDQTTTTAGTITIATNGDYTFTPAKDWNGSVPTITYTTNTGSSSTLNITVTPVDDTPVANDDTATTPEDTPIIIDVLGNDTDVDGDVLTVTQIDGQTASVGVPVKVEHGTATLNTDGTITFTPEAN